MARCVTVDPVVLEKTKLDKLLLKLIKRSEERIKVLAQQVLSNAEQHSKHKTGDSKSAQIEEASKPGAPNFSNSPGRASEPVSTLKRQREATAPVVIVSKRGASVNPSKQSGQPSAKAIGAAGKGTPATKETSKTSGVSTLPIAAPKIKVNHVTTKPSVFSSLQSASKKPGTSNAAQKAAQQNDAKGRYAYTPSVYPDFIEILTIVQ